MMFRTSDKIPFFCEAEETEVNVRLVLHELYSDQLQLLERKIERIRKYMADLESSEVDFKTLMSNSLLDKDNLRWVKEDYELLTMG